MHNPENLARTEHERTHGGCDRLSANPLDMRRKQPTVFHGRSMYGLVLLNRESPHIVRQGGVTLITAP
jgi:hypothetical protein